MQRRLPFFLVAAVLGLSACNEGTDLERAAIGALAGCAVGEVLRDGECITGAVVGAGAGALADDI